MADAPMNRENLLMVFCTETRERLGRALHCLSQGADACDYNPVHQEFDSLHGGARAVDLDWLERDTRVIASYARFLRNLGKNQVSPGAHGRLLDTVQALADQCESLDLSQPEAQPAGGRLSNLLDNLEATLRQRQGPITPRTILVVDDSATSRMLLRAHLPAQEGHTLIEAENRDTALQLAHELHPDVVFMDYNMPDEDGVSIAARMRTASCRARFIPLTANLQQSVRDEANAAGFAGVLEKPVTRDKLVFSLRTLLA